MTEVEKNKKGFGVGEWADSSVNCYYGCSNNCAYCYAKRMAIRFGRIENPEEWKNMKPNWDAINKGYGKREGRVMFPTSHDITIESYENCLIVLKKLLDAGNEVLITTKPNITVISKLCAYLERYKEQIQFRFTITSDNDEILKHFEPNAPDFNQRYLSLVLAHGFNYKTSVSIEPFLDKDPYNLIRKVAPFCTESIWVGKLNYEKREFNSWENVQQVVEHLKLLPLTTRLKLRLKDSIREMYKKAGMKVPYLLYRVNEQ